MHGQVSGKPGDRRVVALGQGYGSEGQSVSKDPASAVGCMGRAGGEQCRGWNEQESAKGSSTSTNWELKAQFRELEFTSDLMEDSGAVQ